MATRIATRIAPDGTRTEVFPADGQAFTLAELYRHVDCQTVELIHMANGLFMWIDEEAKLKDPRPPINKLATRLLHEAGGVTWDAVLGTVLVTTPQEGGSSSNGP